MKKLLMVLGALLMSSPVLAATSLTLNPENLGANLKGYSITVIANCHGESSAVRIKSFNTDFSPYTLTQQDINRLNCTLQDNKVHLVALHITGPDIIPSDINKRVIIPYSSVKCGTIPFSLADNTPWQLSFGIQKHGLYCRVERAVNKPATNVPAVKPAAAVQTPAQPPAAAPTAN